MEKKKLNKKVIIIGIVLLVVIIGIVLFLVLGNNKVEDKPTKKEKKEEVEEVKEKVDIVDLNSKTRPITVSINNTPVAVKVQRGLNSAYIVYELPTEGSTSRLLAVFKDASDDTVIGTVRSARHNFIDFSKEHNAIFASYGWSIYAEKELKTNTIDYIQGIVQDKPFWRENPENLAREHTVYTTYGNLKDFAVNDKGYSMESDSWQLLNYNVEDVDLSTKEGSMVANTVNIPYGSVVTEFRYNADTKMYNRVVNDVVTTDYGTKEDFTTKNVIVAKLNGYDLTPNKIYWDLYNTGSGDVFFITNGYAVPIKWSKESREAKTKYTYLDGSEIEVSDGRTYIELHVPNKVVSIN